ncbi:C2H2-type domain-containing protein [Microbotryomycetes sp. JL221]|nr:C2H2-type domain-containing protein [Microbotryomycetes sp. JL221]
MFTFSSAPPQLAASTAPTTATTDSTEWHERALDAWTTTATSRICYSASLGAHMGTAWHSPSAQDAADSPGDRQQRARRNGSSRSSSPASSTASASLQPAMGPPSLSKLPVLPVHAATTTAATTGSIAKALLAPTNPQMSQRGWHTTAAVTHDVHAGKSHIGIQQTTAMAHDPMAAPTIVTTAPSFAGAPHAATSADTRPTTDNTLQHALVWPVYGQQLAPQQSALAYALWPESVTHLVPSNSVSARSQQPQPSSLTATSQPHLALTSWPMSAPDQWNDTIPPTTATAFPALWSWHDDSQLEPAQATIAPQPQHMTTVAATTSSTPPMHRARHSLDARVNDSPSSDGRPELARQVSEHIMLSALSESSRWSRNSSPRASSILASSVAPSTTIEPALAAATPKASQTERGWDNSASMSARPSTSTAADRVDDDDNEDEDKSGKDMSGKVRKQRRKANEPPRDLAQRRYVCDLCVGEPKLFARPSALRIHKLTHTKEKPHTCPDCNRAFAIASNLKRHRRLHLPGGTKETAASPAMGQDGLGQENEDDFIPTSSLLSTKIEGSKSIEAAFLSQQQQELQHQQARFELPPATLAAGMTTTYTDSLTVDSSHAAPTNLFAGLQWSPTSVPLFPQV